MIPWCAQHGVAVVAYSPFGHNDFPSPRSKAGQVLQTIADARRRIAAPDRPEFSDAPGLRVCDPKSLDLRSTPPTTRPRANLVLSEYEIATLDQAFPRGPKPRGLPML